MRNKYSEQTWKKYYNIAIIVHIAQLINGVGIV